MLIKTYRRDDEGVLHYREAWKADGGVVVHQGRVGLVGRSRVHRAPDPKRFGERFLEQAAADGYRPLPDEERSWAVLQCWLFSADLSHPDDDWIMGEGHDQLDEYLGWRGLGHLDGNDIGGSAPEPYSDLEGPKLNLFCPVVDGPLAVKALRGFVRKFRRPSLYVIGLRAPGEESDYELAYSPRRTDTAFHLF